MIVCRETMTFSQCFVEIDEAVRQLRGKDDVAFNAHRGPAPDGAIIFQTENVPTQVADPLALWPGREIWDLSAANAAKYGAKYVPIGWHPSMERFERSRDLDIDIVFSGAINDRRAKVLNALQERGLHVVVVPIRAYGRQRDALLARAKLALNIRFYEDGIFPVLRTAHLIANHVPVLSETCADVIGSHVWFDEIVDKAADMVARKDGWRALVAADDYCAFRAKPLVLPS